MNIIEAYQAAREGKRVTHKSWCYKKHVGAWLELHTSQTAFGGKFTEVEVYDSEEDEWSYLFDMEEKMLNGWRIVK